MNENTLEEARKIIAGFLKNRRIELGYSQQFLADKCEMSVGTINRMENGHFWLGMKQYLIICQHLHLFPLIATMEEDSYIVEVLRSNWVKSHSISIKKRRGTSKDFDGKRK